jgi:uncharacterized protein
LFPL